MVSRTFSKLRFRNRFRTRFQEPVSKAVLRSACSDSVSHVVGIVSWLTRGGSVGGKRRLAFYFRRRPRGPLILHDVPKGFNFFRTLFLSGRDSGGCFLEMGLLLA